MQTDNTQKAYSEIFEVLKKYQYDIVFDIGDLKRRARFHLFGLELKEKYGLNIDPETIDSLDWIRIDGYRTISLMGKEHKRIISCSDDKTQPKNEMLFQICFSTGAYIFGDDYPEALFQDFFTELKAFGPKYTDSVNHALYFALDNAKNVFNSFDAILKKYHEINRNDAKQRKIQKLQSELDRLIESD